MIDYGRERSRILTFWFRDGGTRDRNGQGVDGEDPGDEESENSSEEHDGMECRGEEQTTTAPGLKFGKWERSGITCTAAEQTKEVHSTLFINFGNPSMSGYRLFYEYITNIYGRHSVVRDGTRWHAVVPKGTRLPIPVTCLPCLQGLRTLNYPASTSISVSFCLSIFVWRRVLARSIRNRSDSPGSMCVRMLSLRIRPQPWTPKRPSAYIRATSSHKNDSSPPPHQYRDR